MSQYQDQVRALHGLLFSEASFSTRNEDLANLACGLVEHYGWDISPEDIAATVESAQQAAWDAVEPWGFDDFEALPEQEHLDEIGGQFDLALAQHA